MSNSSPPNLNLAGGKRGACDRCRGQKLRCIRQDPNQNPPQATCIRCFKAGATCSYGIAKRAGRYPTINPSSPQEWRRNGAGKPRIGRTASRPNVSTSSLSSLLDSEAGRHQNLRETRDGGSSRVSEEYPANGESEKETEDTTLIHALSPSSLRDSSNVLSEFSMQFPPGSASSTATVSWPVEIVPSFSTENAEEDSGLESFGSKYSWAFHDYQIPPMDIQDSTISRISDNEQPRDAETNAYRIHTQPCQTKTQTSGASDEAMDLDLLPTSAHTASFNSKNALDARPHRVRDQDIEWARLPESSGISSIANPTFRQDLTETEAEITLGKKILSVNEVQHQHMQELSILAMDLYAQLTTNDPENHIPRCDITATAFQDQLVGSVLKSSNTFLTLLASFPASSTSSSSSPPSPPASSLNPTCDSSDSDTSPSASAPNSEDHAMDEAVQLSNGKLPAGSSDDSKPPPPIDMATVLQLLTCYIRIIHLHSIMHARILEYLFAFLQQNTPHVDSVPPIFPDMQVGGVSLNRFGTLQLKLLLQISMHVLGEIESTLGLPKELRVGKSKGGRTGVLGASVSGDFMKCLMSEGAWKGKKLEGVKEQLGNLRRVLRRAIDF